MSLTDEINKAIAAHGQWKVRLKTAIDTGNSEFTVERVRPDNNCDFGKWLHGLPADVKGQMHWKTVQQLHADFHKTAAGVLDQALKGDKSGATAGMTSGFATASSKLTTAMMAWKKDAGG